jgi:hypothetical protein
VGQFVRPGKRKRKSKICSVTRPPEQDKDNHDFFSRLEVWRGRAPPAPWCPPPKGPEGIRRESVSIRGFGSRNSDVAASRAENKNDGSRAPPRIPDPTSRLDFCQKAPGYITIIEETLRIRIRPYARKRDTGPRLCSAYATQEKDSCNTLDLTSKPAK